jgi:beta-RFAP synthase
MTRITARTGARLHFGLILGNPANGWEFGGAGLMVDQPGWTLVVQHAIPPQSTPGRRSEPADIIHCESQATRLRLTQLLQRLRSQSPAIPPLDLRVHQQVPPHAGLGSGTQLALACTAAVTWLATGQLPPPAEMLAAMSGRSERSAIGTAGFDCGGFLVDYGRSAPQPRVKRIPVPEHWRFILVRPKSAEGLSGPAEQQWFQSRREMPATLTQTLAALIQEQLIPAISASDAHRFARALEDYGDTVGSFYAPAQGGTFSHPAIRQLAAVLRSAGIHGAAQSSWGPGICIPSASPEEARQILSQIPPELHGQPLETTCTTALNTGALIAREAPEERRNSALA